MLMNPKLHGGGYLVSMTNDPIEALHFASAYAYQDNRLFSREDLPELKKILLEQKKWVEAYSDFRGDYFLATKNCMLSIASSSYFFRCHSPFVGVTVPEHSFLSIENLCLAASSTHNEAAYAFINFVYGDTALKTLHETFFYFPASQRALDFMPLDGVARAVFLDARSGIENHRFFSQPLSPDLVHGLWIEIKNE